MITINKLDEAIRVFIVSLGRKEFKKSTDYVRDGERGLLPFVKFFLLGRFGSTVNPEAKINCRAAAFARKRVDFLVKNIALEIAVRKPDGPKSNLSTYVNAQEVKKLVKHRGLSVLVLFDFARRPYQEEELESFRTWPSLGKGNQQTSSFNVLYYHFKSGKLNCVRKNVRRPR
jgi:hypothetical protein